jgi:hypothetical protein
MKRLTIPFVVAAVAFLGKLAFGQEPAGIPAETIKELDWLVGTWEVAGKIGDKEQTGGFTCWWARTEDKRKCCLIGRFSYKTDGKTRSGVTLIGWNAEKKCIEDRGFDANGGNDTLLWTTKSPTEWEGQVLMVEDGRPVKSKAVLVKKGPSEIVMESESEAGEVSRFVFRRVKKESHQSTKADFAEYGKAMNGHWHGNITLWYDMPGIAKKGDKREVRWEIAFPENGSVIVGTGSDGQVTAASLIYYDVERKQIRGSHVFSYGTVVSYVVHRQDDKTWVRVNTSVDPDGTKTETKDTLVISDGGDTHTWTRDGLPIVFQRERN